MTAVRLTDFMIWKNLEQISPGPSWFVCSLLNRTVGNANFRKWLWVIWLGWGEWWSGNDGKTVPVFAWKDKEVEPVAPLWTVRLHNRPICRHNIDCVYTDKHKNHTVVLAKHRSAPWWWFMREPKHVGACVIILYRFNILWFYNSVH